jgi:hypothetical protein
MTSRIKTNLKWPAHICERARLTRLKKRRSEQQHLYEPQWCLPTAGPGEVFSNSRADDELDCAATYPSGDGETEAEEKGCAKGEAESAAEARSHRTIASQVRNGPRIAHAQGLREFSFVHGRAVETNVTFRISLWLRESWTFWSGFTSIFAASQICRLVLLQ